MNVQLNLLTDADKDWFIRALQHSFKQAFLNELAEDEEIITPADIAASMNSEKAHNLLICVDGEKVGGAVVQIDTQSHRNSLDLFFVQTSGIGKGIGLAAWQAIEQRYPQTQVWETHTPYFEKRNIHFYVNKCGFRIVEFFHHKHPDPHVHHQVENPCFDEVFRFEKIMK